MISIHALVKRATFCVKIFTDFFDNFNPRPRKEDDYRQQAGHRLMRDFNPRPRKEGDLKSQARKFAFAISIHALVKRATRFIVFIILYLRISIHALVKRATPGLNIPPWRYAISIHALVKRATSEAVYKLYVTGYFNPRPRKEGDNILTSSVYLPAYFNPRPRKEGDIAVNIVVTIFSIFQSTPS